MQCFLYIHKVHHYQSQLKKIFITLKRNLISFSIHSPPLPLAQSTFSDSIVLLVLDISYKPSPTLLVIVLSHSPVLSRFIHAVALYIPPVYIPPFVYSFIRQWILGLLPLLGYCITLKMFLSSLFLSNCICSIYLLSLF